MKLLKTIFGNALVLATLVIGLASLVLVAHSGSQAEAGVQRPVPDTKADRGTPTDTAGWMKVRRGSLVDAML